MGLFKKQCFFHDWKICQLSNVLQLDDNGNPLRLVICECSKCKALSQRWVEVNKLQLKELDTGKSILVKWL